MTYDNIKEQYSNLGINSKKTIFIITQPEVLHIIGGAITVFINLCNMLAENGFVIYGACYGQRQGYPKNLKDNVKFTNLYEEYNGIEYSIAINKKIKDIKPDLIIFFFPYFYANANLSSEFDNIPRILMFHSRPDIYFAEIPWLENKLKSLYKNTVSQILFDSYKTLLPKYIQESNVITIPNGVYFTNKKINLEAEHKRIIYLSRIDCWKGLEFLIKSFKIIAKKYPDWTIDIYGQSQPPEYVTQLEKYIKTLHLENQINFKGITDNPIDTFMQYDFCVFPSYFEGFPMGLIEALSVGLPCIGLQRCSGVNELIIDNYNGYLIEEKPKDFAKKMESLILDRNKRIEFSKNAICEAKKYDIEIINKKWLEIIEKIINKNFENSSLKNTIKNHYALFPIKKIMNMKQIHKNNKWYQNIFSVRNSDNKKHKVITIFGLKIKIKRKAKNHA